jgi:hypothetical protein
LRINRIVIITAVLLTGCAGPQTSAPPTASPTRSGAAEQTVLAELNETSTMADTLGTKMTSALARCMARHGHRQMESSLKADSRRPAAVPRPALGIHPLELGPTTVAEATKYGMIGVGLGFSEVSAPSVVSKNKEYDEAGEVCLSRELSGAGELAEARQRWSQVLNESRLSLVKRTEPAIKAILMARVNCVRQSGYGKLVGSRFLAGDLKNELQRIGVTPGRHLESKAQPAVPREGTVTVYPTERQIYQPSTSERKFAVVYVACGDCMNFRKKLADVVTPAVEAEAKERADVIRKYHRTFSDGLVRQRDWR